MIIGIFKTSLKENEKRVPLYPSHLRYLPNELRSNVYLENGYGKEFKITDSDLEQLGYKTVVREQLFVQADVIVLPKPTVTDLKLIPEGKILWGWTHCVQNYEIAQIAIEKKLTYVSWENMHLWEEDRKNLHIFYKNNEIAGYASILHALELLGMDGFYGERKSIIVFGYGSVSKGAIRALHGRGFNNITVLSKRPFHLIADKDPDVYYKTYEVGNTDIVVRDMDVESSLHNILSNADILVNGILQDVTAPITFVSDTDLASLKPGCLIVDVSCDKGMGFEFAQPTTFENPMLEIGDVYYYAVDHTPTYLWQAASREISFALLPFIPLMIGGPEAVRNSSILLRAIDIDKGVVINNDLLLFQRRAAKYPHKIKKNG